MCVMGCTVSKISKTGQLITYHCTVINLTDNNAAAAQQTTCTLQSTISLTRSNHQYLKCNKQRCKYFRK